MALLKRYWFLFGLAIMILAAWTFPQGGELVRKVRFVLPVLVAMTLLVSGFTLDNRRLFRQTANLRAILVGLLTTYLVAPFLAYFLAILFAPSSASGPSEDQFLEAMMIAAAQAATLSSAIALTAMARGNVELALVLTVTSNVLTALLTPIILKATIGALVYFPLGDMMLRMALVVLLPVLAGQVARRFLWDLAQPALPAIRIVPQIIILIMVYTGFSAATRYLWEKPAVALHFLAACGLLHVFLVVWTAWISSRMGLSPASRTAVIFSGSQKTLPNGIYLWDRFFAGNPYGAVPLALYHIFQLVVDTLLIPWLERGNPVDEEDEGSD